MWEQMKLQRSKAEPSGLSHRCSVAPFFGSRCSVARAATWERRRLKGTRNAMSLQKRKLYASRNKCHATSNKCLTSSNKKLLIAKRKLYASKLRTEQRSYVRGDARSPERSEPCYYVAEHVKKHIVFQIVCLSFTFLLLESS